MKKLAVIVAIALTISAALFAQSSGNFTANVATTRCTIDNNSGTLGEGLAATTILTSTIKTPNGSGTALLIRPSFVTGLYTSTKLSSTDTVMTATGNIGIKVFVTLDGAPVAPNFSDDTCNVTIDGANVGCGVIYDQRFQQLTTNLLKQITSCPSLTDPSQTGACELGLLLSTLGAHSMDHVAPALGVGDHVLKVYYKLDPAPVSNGNVTTAACVGPGVVTVQQVKNFSQTTPICISSNGSCP